MEYYYYSENFSVRSPPLGIDQQRSDTSICERMFAVAPERTREPNPTTARPASSTWLSSSALPCLCLRLRLRQLLLRMASPPPAPAAGRPHGVFVYGTLMAEEVVRVLLGRAPPSSPATLPDHQRFGIKGRVYPAILPVQGKQVDGKVFKDLTDRELQVFDIFEDEEYVRKTVEVSLTDTSEKLLAYAYIWGNASDPDLFGQWDFEEWRKVQLMDYLEMTKEFMDELEESELKPQA